VRIPRWLGATVLLLRAGELQSQTPADVSRTLLLELRLPADSILSQTIRLRKGVVYWAEVSGPGTLSIRSGDGQRDAFIVPIETLNDWRRFQVFAMRSGPHQVTLTERPPGSTSIVRIFSDTATTEKLRAQRDRGFAIGFGLAAGVHSGLAVDSSGGASPAGGGDVEGCLLLRSGSIASTCLGFGKQRLPDAHLNLGWFFIEERLRFLRAQFISSRPTALEATLRFGQSTGIPGRNVYPTVIAFGLQLGQHLTRDNRSHGVRAVASWQRQQLRDAPTSRDRAGDRFVVGVTWLP